MKSFKVVLLISLATFSTYCSRTPIEKAKSAVQAHMKEYLKNPSSYEPLWFDQIDTLKQGDTLATNKNSFYRTLHHYEVINSDKDKIFMTVTFYFDKDWKVTETSTKSINGDFGKLTGNAFWRYNNYVGDKPDAGSTIALYSLDTMRENVKFEVTADVQGNYIIDKIPPGKYFLMVRSNNTTDCPEDHLRNFKVYSPYLKKIFKFDMDVNGEKIREISIIDSLATAALISNDKTYESASRSLSTYHKHKEARRKLIEELFEQFPGEFKSAIKLYTSYSNAYDLKVLDIEEGHTTNFITDFGITCI